MQRDRWTKVKSKKRKRAQMNQAQGPSPEWPWADCAASFETGEVSIAHNDAPIILAWQCSKELLFWHDRAKVGALQCECRRSHRQRGRRAHLLLMSWRWGEVNH